MKKLDNRGFTLVELIVVIAVLGILSGVASYSVNQIFTNRVHKFVNEYDTMLTRCRVETLAGAPSGTHVELRQESDGHYYVALYIGSTKTEEEKLGDSNISCTYTTSSGTMGTVDSTTSLSLGFNRSTGALASSYPQVTEINISGTKITMVPSTGYHKIGG